MLLRPCPVPPGAWFRQCRCPQGAGVTTSRIISKQKAGRGSVQTSPEHGKTLGKVFRDRAGCVHIGPAGESDPVTLRAAKPQSRREETPIRRPRFAQQILHPPQQFVVQGMAPVRNRGNWGGGGGIHPTPPRPFEFCTWRHQSARVPNSISPCPHPHEFLSPSPSDLVSRLLPPPHPALLPAPAGVRSESRVLGVVLGGPWARCSPSTAPGPGLGQFWQGWVAPQEPLLVGMSTKCCSRDPGEGGLGKGEGSGVGEAITPGSLPSSPPPRPQGMSSAEADPELELQALPPGRVLAVWFQGQAFLWSCSTQPE